MFSFDKEICETEIKRKISVLFKHINIKICCKTLTV